VRLPCRAALPNRLPGGVPNRVSPSVGWPCRVKARPADVCTRSHGRTRCLSWQRPKRWFHSEAVRQTAPFEATFNSQSRRRRPFQNLINCVARKTCQFAQRRIGSRATAESGPGPDAGIDGAEPVRLGSAAVRRGDEVTVSRWLTLSSAMSLGRLPRQSKGHPCVPGRPRLRLAERGVDMAVTPWLAVSVGAALRVVEWIPCCTG
jgi:hypothetical protein